MSVNNYFEEIGAWPQSSVSLGSYVLGFVVSLGLTGVAYVLTVHHTLPQYTLIAILFALMGVQCIVQMMYFLHLGTGAESRERLFILLGTGVVVGILVSGSLWIMVNLNQRMMPSQEQVSEYMQSQQGM